MEYFLLYRNCLILSKKYGICKYVLLIFFFTILTLIYIFNIWSILYTVRLDVKQNLTTNINIWQYKVYSIMYMSMRILFLSRDIKISRKPKNCYADPITFFNSWDPDPNSIAFFTPRDSNPIEFCLTPGIRIRKNLLGSASLPKSNTNMD